MIREFLIKSVGVRVAERVKRWPVRTYLRELEESQWWTPDQIRDTQNDGVSKLVLHAYDTVPLYRELLDERGIRPADIRSVDDLSRLPILTKETIRANFPDGIVSDRFPVSTLVPMSSSGSTGEPFRYYMANEEKARKWAGLYRFWRWAGCEMGDRHVNLTAFPHGAFKDSRIGRFIEQRYSGALAISAYELYSENANDCIRRIVDFRPRVLRGYPSLLNHLVEVMGDRGKAMSLRSVCTTGETLFDFQRELLESCFGCEVYDAYGGDGMEIAGQCGVDGSYHVNAENVVLEIVDERGNPCAPGVEGQIVLTDLNRRGMPFIRYNIQDIGVARGGLCSCGRGLPVLDRIVGRVTDVGVTPSGKMIAGHLVTALFGKSYPAVRRFQVTQERPDLIIVNAIPGPGFDVVMSDIMRSVQDYVGNDVSVQARAVEDIPVTANGKRRLFVSKCAAKAVGLTGMC